VECEPFHSLDDGPWDFQLVLRDLLRAGEAIALAGRVSREFLGVPRGDGPGVVGAAQEKNEKAQGEDGMAQTGSEVFPERCAGAGVVGGEEQRQREDEAKDAGNAHEQAEDEGKSDGEFAVRHQVGQRLDVREDEAAQNGLHERVNALFEELHDPELETAVAHEFGAEDFVLAEDEEQDADGDAQQGEGAIVTAKGFGHSGEMIPGKRQK